MLVGLSLLTLGGSHVVRAMEPSEVPTIPEPSQVGPFFNVTTEPFRFVPDELRVPANVTIHVRLTQKASSNHTFTVSAERDFVLPTNWSTAQVDQYFTGNNLTDTQIPAEVDRVVWANFTTPAEPGRYEFVCRFPGHFQNGMLGFLVVEIREAFVNLTTEGLRFVPDEFAVPPGALVHLQIVQKDTVPHTFTVGKERDFVLPSDWTTPEVDTYFAGNNLTDVTIPAREPPQVEVVLMANFTAPFEPGRYEFVCRFPGHFQDRMVGFMIVSESAPPPRGGPPIGPITGIMLLTLGSVLVFVAFYHVRAVRAAKRNR